MLPLKIIFSFIIITLLDLIFSEGAWAWGPAIHTVISCTILERAGQILPSIASVIEAFPLEYIYGSLAADFFIGKGHKQREGHSHNWETGFTLLESSGEEKEAAYAYGFLSHLAADVVSHNYFVPDFIHRISTLKRIGHIYSEALADKSISPQYIRIAKDVLTMEDLDCDQLLRSAMVRNSRGLKARRHIFTQSVKISDYLCCLPHIISSKNRKTSYPFSSEYLIFMINLSYRLVKNLLSFPYSSPCLSHDPIGSYNLRIASKNGVLSRLFNVKGPIHHFPIDRKLLEL